MFSYLQFFIFEYNENLYQINIVIYHEKQLNCNNFFSILAQPLLILIRK